MAHFVEQRDRPNASPTARAGATGRAESAHAGFRRPVHRPGGRVRLLWLAGHQGVEGARHQGRADEPKHRLWCVLCVLLHAL